MVHSGKAITHTTTTQKDAHTMDRNTTIKAIRKALRDRSGKTWSVTGGRGSAWGWIRISAPPARTDEYGRMSTADANELGTLLGFDKPVHFQGQNVPSSNAYYQEYLDRAHGRTPTVYGTPYWD